MKINVDNRILKIEVVTIRNGQRVKEFITKACANLSKAMLDVQHEITDKWYVGNLAQAVQYEILNESDSDLKVYVVLNEEIIRGMLTIAIDEYMIEVKNQISEDNYKYWRVK
jgi:dsDNA-binding SOS-regulon protein